MTVNNPGLVNQPNRVFSTSIFIRDRLDNIGMDYPYKMWLAYKEVKRDLGHNPGAYSNFIKYIWILNKLGLIEKHGLRTVRKGFEGRSNKDKYQHTFYKLVRAKKRDVMWINPQKVYMDGLT